MDFSWDPEKASTNRRKHRVELADAVGVFEDPHGLSQLESRGGEARMVTVGRDMLDSVLVVVWAWDDDDIRIISARRATARERRQYSEDADA